MLQSLDLYRMNEPIRLTQYAHGAGCGCKIAPQVLEEILRATAPLRSDPRLLVGHESRDDAAVYDNGDGTGLVSTTDFFMPIVDDAFDFGRIAAANALSDVYAMGGTPLLAIAILGWPVEKLPASLAGEVVNGGRSICATAGIPLAGGHSIDSPEPFFGLAVTGRVALPNLKKNNTAQAGDRLYVTKPLGVGILTTAGKRGLLQAEHADGMLELLTSLNRIGERLGALPGVTAMTDITGFGLLGHLIEMTEGSGCSAELYYDRIPVANGVRDYIAQRIFPDATTRNWSSYGQNIAFEKGVNVLEAFTLLPDPQTNGGLLVSVRPEQEAAMTELLGPPIGRITVKGEKAIVIAPHQRG